MFQQAEAQRLNQKFEENGIRYFLSYLFLLFQKRHNNAMQCNITI